MDATSWRRPAGAGVAAIALVTVVWLERLHEKPEVQAMLTRAGYEQIVLRTRVIDLRRCGRGLDMPTGFTAYRGGRRFVGSACLSRRWINARPG